MTVPSDYDFIGNTITESQFKNALTVLLNHIRQMSLDLTEIQGGNYSYVTMALFDADKLNVSNNSTVRIAQGDDAGLYVWDGVSLHIADGDTLNISQNYADKKANNLENHIQDLYTALLQFLMQYDTDIYKAFINKMTAQQHAFNQSIVDQLLNIDSIINNSRSENQKNNALYALLSEFNKLDGIDLANIKNNAVATSFASDMHVPTDKFGVDKGELKGVLLKVSSDSTAFDAQDLESPYIIYDEKLKKYVMVYTGYAKNHAKSSIGWAVSDDLIAWTKQGELISASGIHSNGDQYGMTGPALYYYDGLYYLYYLGLNGAGYEGEPINMCLATSPSLTSPNWTYHGVKIPIQYDKDWANEAIYHANIFTYNGKWWIFFNARGVVDGVQAERFGYATSDSIDGEWTVSKERVSEALEVNKTFIRAGDPALFEYNGLIYVFYFSVLENGKALDHWGWTTPAEFPNNWRFGGDLLDNTPAYQATYAHKPFVVKRDNTLFHYYTAVGDQGRCIALKTYDLT